MYLIYLSSVQQSVSWLFTLFVIYYVLKGLFFWNDVSIYSASSIFIFMVYCIMVLENLSFLIGCKEIALL